MSFKVEKATRIRSKNGAKSGILYPSEEAEKILGDISFGILFSYCFRRFGFPNYGTDSYTSMVSYFVTTPMKGCYLWIDPRPSECSMFGYITSKTLFKKLHRERCKDFIKRWRAVRKFTREKFNDEFATEFTGATERQVGKVAMNWFNANHPELNEWEEVTEDLWRHYWTIQREKAEKYSDLFDKAFPNYKRYDPMKDKKSSTYQANEALKVAIKDLLRPTFVRDCYFNVKGFESKENPMNMEDASYSVEAGLGIDRSYFWGKL